MDSKRKYDEQSVLRRQETQVFVLLNAGARPIVLGSEWLSMKTIISVQWTRYPQIPKEVCRP